MLMSQKCFANGCCSKRKGLLGAGLGQSGSNGANGNQEGWTGVEQRVL